MAFCTSRHRGLHSWRRRRRAPATLQPVSSPLQSSITTGCAAVRAATRVAYDKHFQSMKDIYATQNGGAIAVNMSMVVALRAFGAAARADGAAEPPADPSHQGFQEGPTPRRLLEIGSALGSEAVLFALICRKPIDVIALDVSAPCVEFAQAVAGSQTPGGAKLRFVAADVADIGSSAELDSALGVGRCLGGGAVAVFERPFQLIYSTGTLHHLPPADLLTALCGLRARADPGRGVLVCSFHAFTAASLMPRKGGSSRIRGLTPTVIQGLPGGGKEREASGGAPSATVDEPVLGAVRRVATSFNDRLLAEILAPGATLPLEYQHRFLRDLVDAETTEDDGGGLGACVLTGEEALGIPGRYERHYTPSPLRAIFERAGWHVHECRDNTAAETGPGTEGQLIYVIAHARRSLAMPMAKKGT